MSGDFSKWGAPEGTPSNDPRERGDSIKKNALTDVAAPKYTTSVAGDAKLADDK